MSLKLFPIYKTLMVNICGPLLFLTYGSVIVITGGPVFFFEDDNGSYNLVGFIIYDVWGNDSY